MEYRAIYIIAQLILHSTTVNAHGSIGQWDRIVSDARFIERLATAVQLPPYSTLLCTYIRMYMYVWALRTHAY